MKKLSHGILSICVSGAVLLSACGHTDDPERTTIGEAINGSSPNTNQVPSTQEEPMNAITTSTDAIPDSEQLIDPAHKEISDITVEDFKQGVFIDFDQYKQSFFDDEIISKFKGNIEAVVEKNPEKFKENLNKDSAATNKYHSYYINESEKGKEFMFYDLDILEKVNIDEREQIRVGVRFAQKSSDGRIDNTGITYFFTKNQDGEWGIENID
ncbi:hypothetical protein MH215_04950 [Paenibacillus sp. ACRSA]|uniref:hypothetical protein n=1 Tax=Paenibacillus sp. ACRSA TaxID=2918211 RepID=UPI001EF59301|nr:hypothetical protein [Paenibacillus sp. ACRSA]MCG7376330.1 hypothetical protein [Paenibacillus sp. ACRSA]